jgi:hypothetical protein
MLQALRLPSKREEKAGDFSVKSEPNQGDPHENIAKRFAGSTSRVGPTILINARELQAV